MALQNTETRKNERNKSIKSLYDYAMGILWIGVGLFFIFHEKLGFEWFKNDPLVDYIFGFVALLYGAYRLFRGFKNKY